MGEGKRQRKKPIPVLLNLQIPHHPICTQISFSGMCLALRRIKEVGLTKHNIEHPFLKAVI